MTGEVRTVFRGGIVHCVDASTTQLLEDGVLGLDQSNRIVFVEDGSQLALLQDRYGFAADARTIQLKPHQFLMPGFIDTHIHASQYPNAGTGLDMPLLQWLETYTFPTEAMFANPEFAQNAYEKVVQRTLRSGTTACSYFTTIHREASTTLVETCERLGQRAYVGKVCMDRNSPSTYIEVTNESIRETEAFVQATLARNSELVTPIVTPRFVPTCSSQLMTGLGEVARRYNVPIQSHVSENAGEIEWVRQLHPQCSSYSDVYDVHGLLNSKAIMAHGVHLSEAEMQLLSARKVGVSHCPCSNYGILSGICRVRDLHQHNVKVGLGTDVSGGHSPAMLESLRLALIASKTVHFQEPALAPLRLYEGLHLATLGGAEVMGLQDQIGNFAPGKHFDALIVDPSSIDSPIDVFAKDKFSDRVEKFLFNGDDRNIVTVFVNGKVVKRLASAPALTADF
ncbi:guanine deaminase [Capsaspora owczarzaki ATCC 30864]|uniref:Guanine deaminase n=1 Tax=Capsaspora owczarzaki (strain ATCC 30864) TaxID=595528 RepID=A0A0D2WN25_CAPO3|nr:guanine deaminase [Capsaspora owczarzaki ATCC 30864]KJE91703.1 guanine deaminase [Capsaspora owczarzaki ATCC 30864]|eukprot:XP_004348612.2 guanine deaminase [Capsaspora owczarzaki ATCC 30864]